MLFRDHWIITAGKLDGKDFTLEISSVGLRITITNQLPFCCSKSRMHPPFKALEEEIQEAIVSLAKEISIDAAVAATE